MGTTRYKLKKAKSAATHWTRVQRLAGTRFPRLDDNGNGRPTTTAEEKDAKLQPNHAKTRPARFSKIFLKRQIPRKDGAWSLFFMDRVFSHMPTYRDFLC